MIPIVKKGLDVFHSLHEDRWQVLGSTNLGVLFVVYAERIDREGFEIIRIISARPATRFEVVQYQNKTFVLSGGKR